ncbi:unnamed protein product, partial [marine sediment metagenome]
FSLVLRALNLMLLGEVKPENMLLCTFTEKAAYEMRDRLSESARKVGLKVDLSQLLIGTIHGMSNHFVTRYRHHTNLGQGYQALDDLTQLLFLYDRFDEIFWEPDAEGKYLHHWTTRWTAIKGASEYFNKITEELVDPNDLIGSTQPFISAVGKAYLAYQDSLFETNHVDFAHMQKIFLELLEKPDIGEKIIDQITYVLVDEYQDTNYIQEQLLLKLTSSTHNLCVVGDEDQSLYRFRGATVRNILEFPRRVEDCRLVKLTTNYRSHQKIVAAYDEWMASADWTDPDGRYFRYDKTIDSDPEAEFPEYPAVFCIWGTDKRDEARRFAGLVEFLKEKSIISDYSQIALLLHSVRSSYSSPFIEALEAKGIPAFCPRARAYFEEDEVRWIVAAFALILGYFEDGRGDLRGYSLKKLSEYVDDCILDLGK